MTKPHRSTALVSRPLLGVGLLGLLVLCLAPLLLMAERLAGDPSVITDLVGGRTLLLLLWTVLLGLGAASIALAIGLPFGFLVSRTDVLGARWLRALGIVPILLPPIMLAMTWTMLLPLRGPVMCALILGVSSFPLVALFAARAAERIDARREEAALLTGGLGSVLAMELPLILPSALGGSLLAFVVAINDFALPDYVSSVGRKFNVYAGEVFSTWQVDGNEARAVATALPLLALTAAVVLPLLRARARSGGVTIDSTFQHPRTLKLGRWRAPATLFCLAVVTVGALLPIGRLAYESGGGSRVFSGVSIRRDGWTQGGGAAQNMGATPAPTLTGAGVTDAVSAAQAAARAASGGAPASSPSPGTSPGTSSARAAAPQGRQRSVDPAAPEVEAALEASATDDLSDFGGGLPAFASNIASAFARALDLSRESLLWSLLFAFGAATLATPLALILGHAIARGPRGVTLEFLTILPLAAPGTLFGIGSIVLWNHDATGSFYDSGGLVVVLFAGRFLAVATLICAGAVRSFDRRLEESAELAGAGPARRLFGILTPGIWTSLAGSWIAVFALSVRELDAAVLVPAANDTAMFRVFNAVHFGRDDFVSALSLLVVFAILLPGLLWTLFSRRRLRFLP